MNIDELKTQWQELRLRVDKLEDNNARLAHQLAAGKAVNYKHQLAKTFQRGIVVSCVLPILAPLVVTVLNFPLWIAICYALFGVIMVCGNIWIRNYIMKADYMSLPVLQALENAINLKLRMRRLRILSVTIGSGVILSMLVEIIYKTDTAITTGFVVGLVIGTILGIIKWREQSRLSRQIIEELRNADRPTLLDFD